MKAITPSLRELTESDADAVVLKSFYDHVYVREFPDPDERESLANMETYLRIRKPSGWYGKNNYHIIIAELDGRTAGLCVADYLADANVGVIEFLVVLPEARGCGLGRQMLDHIQGAFIADAQRAHGTDPRGIAAEMNDPFRTSLLDDNLDPFDRATLWDHWGFRLLDMPYVQPPLSDTQDAVDSLILIAKPLLPPCDAWPAETVRALIRDYLIYAMRLANPEASPHFTAMADWLGQRAQVALRPLAASVGRDPVIPWIDVRDRRDPAFAAAMRLHHAAVVSDISLDAEGFAAFLDARSNPNLRYTYHLWVVPDPVGDEVQAFASFFSLGHCGFGGYVRRRRLPRHPPDVSVAVAIASVEERMRRDNPAIEGWFIECDPQDAKHPASLFYRHGFREVAVAYRQPPLPGRPHEFSKAKVLTLLYKPLGGRSRMPVLTTGLFLSAMEDMFRVVYGMPQPARSAYHAHLRSQLSADSTALVPFNAEAPMRRRA